MQKARLAGGFLRHRGLIAFSAGGAMAEAAVLSFLAPSARPLAPQVTALPPLAAYHDLRWVFAFNQSWLGFTGVLVLLLLARSAIDAVLVLLAWPRADGTQETGLPRPRFVASAVSCAVLTVLVWLVMSPVVTLMFGVALVPFSWPYLAAVPIMLGTALALSQGGVGQAWWRRLPPVRTVGWLLATFAVLSAASVLMTRLDTVAAVAVAGLAGIIDARAWYGLTAAAVARGARGDGSPRTREVPGGRPPGLVLLRRALLQRTSWIPAAPLAAVMVLALVVGLARLTFTGTVRFSIGTSDVVAAASRASSAAAPAGASEVKAEGATAASSGTESLARGAVLVVGGFGSNCCNDANALRAAEPRMLVRQFSYLGLNRAGQPIPYYRAGDLSIQALGDRMAVQAEKLYQQAHAPVDIVAESEGTLGLYAMLARHPHVHVGSVVLLSPIVDPDQVGQAGDSVPGEALLTLNDLIGGMSPYGGAGAQALIDSVTEVGASYFDLISRDRGLPWLAVVPLADATTLPACSWPRNVVFIGAFHGGLLGKVFVQRLVERFLATGSPGQNSRSQAGLRRTAEVISAAATAWRMPELHSACPS
jgi:hypothetical protein